MGGGAEADDDRIMVPTGCILVSTGYLHDDTSDLWYSGIGMGRPQELEDKVRESRKKKERDVVDDDTVNDPQSKRRRVRADTDDEAVYHPKTKETRAAYEAMLSLIQLQLGGPPLNVVVGAADEILALLKNETFGNSEKEMEIEKLLNFINNRYLDQLVSIGKLITDFQETGDSSGGGGGKANDDGLGVAVEFEEKGVDDEESDPADMVQEEDDEEDEETTRTRGMRVGAGINDEDEGHSNEGTDLNVHDIDAFWLQRKISHAYEQQIDPQQCQVLAEELLKILAEGDDMDVEKKLLVHLQFEKFSLVKFLLRNRLKVVWCTRLARAEDQEKRNRIEETMRGLAPELTTIVEQLHATRATAKEREENLQKSINEEIRHFKHETGGDGGRGRRAVADRDLETGWMKGQRQMLDLDSLAFDQGGLLMGEKKCDFPPGSYISHGKGYDEVHVPWVSKKVDSNEKLVKITEMPDWAQPAFKGMRHLNSVQSKVYDTALFKAENILLCAPTGAGKTNVAMLTILQQLELNRNEDGTYNHGDDKIVYVAPMKALVTEVVGNLSNRLKDYGVTVRELSGDQSLTGREIKETQIIVTTPEKWDIITRKSGDRTYTQLVRLLIIDEIHLLHDSRGPVLESIVARTLRQIETTKENIRLVGLSATLPNYEDVALFLRVDLKKGLFKFDSSYRPVSLHQQYIGITVKKPLHRFQLMNDLCYQKVLAGAGKHQVLIFVHSRKETAKTAKAIRDSAIANDTVSRLVEEDSVSRGVLRSHMDIVKNRDLQDILPYGFAIHHAGLTRSDREIVEYLFAQGHVKVLVSTATLAWGVNLPAHTVIIKGTQVYNPEKGAWMELSPLDVMQMLGRAGRPQYDQHGEGIIITGHSELQYYLSLMNEQLPIESQFISRLADQLNAEIVLGTVQNAREACHWLGYTYLYIRMVRNPTLYGLAPDALANDVVLEERRADLIHSTATILDKNNLVKYDRKSGYFQATDLGRIASYYYITHGTIATYNEHLKPTMGDIDLCRLFSLSEEFKYVTVRQDEKMEQAKLLVWVPIPIKETLEDPSAKINVLLQAYISRLTLEGFSLTSDMVYITQTAGRLLRALYEIVLKRGWAQLAEKALSLSKMVDKRMWSVQTPLRQFHGIPNETLMMLEKKDLVWERYCDLSSQDLGELFRRPKMGRPLYKLIHQVPKLILSAHVQPITRSVLRVELTVTPDFQWDDKIHKYVEPFWIIVDNPQSPEFLIGKLEEVDPFVSQISEETLKETLRHGIGYLHEGLSSLDQEIVIQLFEAGRIQACVMSSSLCWGTPLTAHLVVIMGTQYYDVRENSHSDYPVSDLLQMMGLASRPLLDNTGKCVIFCHAPRREYYKKFLYEALPVESHFQYFLHDNFNSEVVAGVIENKQDAVDYLTWTFMYRRLLQNPNYYNLQGVSHKHLSDHLTELVENTLSDLEASKCIEIEDETELSPLNLGMIASYYYISCTTVKRFSSLLSSKTKMKGLLEILTSASEYDLIPIRPGEEDTVRRLINHQRFSFENQNCTDPHVKANVLLQAHFSRQNIDGNLVMDQCDVLISATRLLQAMVNVISSNGWLNLALLAMEVSQMVTQGMWEQDSMLLQLPHFTEDLAKRCQENPGKNIKTVFDLMEMEDVERQELLKMQNAQLLDIARFCNRFPNIELAYEVVGSEEVTPRKVITLQVMLERDMEGRTEVGPVDSLRYSKSKEEGWWLVVGDNKTNQLLAIKRVSLQWKAKVNLDFTVPSEPGEKSYTLYFMCDSYKGCDQEYSFLVDVKGSCAGNHMEE
ncbi:PREDICTED: DExH-box ATP-dependent RNA helicase DExH12-like isoform X2 [Camelina sativa]|uniref:DExH-box ATP-dependent RNA helicase DExH12-like isoform X2 n=1 Tax=Camelina sativa TaxID=90675 RepID=A0ABM0TFJ2_CAMSA|nr:PREDICTED: DExH-box ATP-dependent RNA helicase DExH12-like isoform X2 [Camelina sativa]